MLRWRHMTGCGQLHTQDSGSQGKLLRFKISSHSEDQEGIYKFMGYFRHRFLYKTYILESKGQIIEKHRYFQSDYYMSSGGYKGN